MPTFKKDEKPQTKNLTLYLKNWKKNKVSRREEILKTKAEVNKMKNRRI